MDGLPELSIISGPTRAVLPIEFPSKSGPVVRKFVLTEHTAEELVDYYNVQEKAREESVKQLAESGNLVPTVQEALPLFVNYLTPTLLNLLREPADGKPAPTGAELMKLPVSRRVAILTSQDQLSGLDEALGKSLGLVERALKLRAASIIASSS